MQNGYLYDVVGTSSHRGFSIFVLITAPLPKSPSPKPQARSGGGGRGRLKKKQRNAAGEEGGEKGREGERKRSIPPPRIKLYLDRNGSSSPSVPDSWSRGRHTARSASLSAVCFLPFLSPPLYPIPRSSPFFFFFQAFPLLTPFERGDVGREKRRITGRKGKSDNEADQSVCGAPQLAGGDSNEPRVGVLN